MNVGLANSPPNNIPSISVMAPRCDQAAVQRQLRPAQFLELTAQLRLVAVVRHALECFAHPSDHPAGLIMRHLRRVGGDPLQDGWNRRDQCRSPAVAVPPRPESMGDLRVLLLGRRRAGRGSERGDPCQVRPRQEAAVAPVVDMSDQGEGGDPRQQCDRREARVQGECESVQNNDQRNRPAETEPQQAGGGGGDEPSDHRNRRGNAGDAGNGAY